MTQCDASAWWFIHTAFMLQILGSWGASVTSNCLVSSMQSGESNFTPQMFLVWLTTLVLNGENLFFRQTIPWTFVGFSKLFDAGWVLSEAGLDCYAGGQPYFWPQTDRLRKQPSLVERRAAGRELQTAVSETGRLRLSNVSPLLSSTFLSKGVWNKADEPLHTPALDQVESIFHTKERKASSEVAVSTGTAQRLQAKKEGSQMRETLTMIWGVPMLSNAA